MQKSTRKSTSRNDKILNHFAKAIARQNGPKWIILRLKFNVPVKLERVIPKLDSNKRDMFLTKGKYIVKFL